MTDLNISYEDGLRLSELVGQLESQQFELDHFAQMATPMAVGVGVALAVLVTFILMCLWNNYCVCYLNSRVKSKYQDVTADSYNPCTLEWERHTAPGPEHCLKLNR